MLVFFTFLNSFYKPTIVFLSSLPPPTPPPNASPLTLREGRHEHLWWTPKGVRDNWVTTCTNWKMKGNALLRAEHLGYWLSTSISAIEFPFYRGTGTQQLPSLKTWDSQEMYSPFRACSVTNMSYKHHS